MVIEPKEEGIIGVDNAAKDCPVCGYKPRIHVHRFRYLEGEGEEERQVIIRRSYYDCSVCGRSITDWMDDPHEEVLGQKKYTGYGARRLWDRRRFL